MTAAHQSEERFNTEPPASQQDTNTRCANARTVAAACDVVDTTEIDPPDDALQEPSADAPNAMSDALAVGQSALAVGQSTPIAAVDSDAPEPASDTQEFAVDSFSNYDNFAAY